MIDRYLAPAEARRLAWALSTVLALLALAGTFAFIVVPSLRPQRLRDRGAPTGPLAEGWLDPTDYPPAPKRLRPPLDPDQALTPSAASRARGTAQYAQYCASCHGPKGHGDGPAGRGLQPPPRNFAEAGGWRNGPQLETIYRTLGAGLPGSAMAAYDFLGRADRLALAQWVRDLGGRQEPSDPRQLEALRQDFASAGESIPARIPVRRSMERLCREFQPARPVPGWPRERLLRSAIWDPARAAQCLARGPRPDPARLAAQAPWNGFAPRIATWPRERWDRLCALLLRTEESP